jgi:hypothetical protein
MMTQDELDKRIGDHEEWFATGRSGKQLELTDVTLGGRLIRNRRLHDCILQGVDLSGCMLENTKFLRAKLDNVIFDHAVAQNCEFSDAKVSNCSFADTDLACARFDGVYARKCKFVNAKLTQSFFVKSHLDSIVFDRCDMTESNFFRTHAFQCSFAASILKGVDFTHSLLIEADLRSSNIQDVLFDCVKLDRPLVCGLKGPVASIGGLSVECADYSFFADGTDVRSLDDFLALVRKP